MLALTLMTWWGALSDMVDPISLLKKAGWLECGVRALLVAGAGGSTCCGGAHLSNISLGYVVDIYKGFGGIMWVILKG